LSNIGLERYELNWSWSSNNWQKDSCPWQIKTVSGITLQTHSKLSLNLYERIEMN